MTKTEIITASELLARRAEIEPLVNAGRLLMTTGDGGRSWMLTVCIPRQIPEGPAIMGGAGEDSIRTNGGWNG